jgi:hypothetical protein
MKHFDDLARSHQQARASTKRASAVLCTVINVPKLQFLPEEPQDIYFNRSELHGIDLNQTFVGQHLLQKGKK